MLTVRADASTRQPLAKVDRLREPSQLGNPSGRHRALREAMAQSGGRDGQLLRDHRLSGVRASATVRVSARLISNPYGSCPAVGVGRFLSGWGSQDAMPGSGHSSGRWQ